MGMGTTEIGVIRDSVRAFIDAKTDADDALKARFEVERERLRQVQQQPIRLIKSDDV
jgi:hypothetical protein